jgi:dihydroorotase
MEPEKTAAEAQRYPGLIVGIKIAHYAGPEWLAVDRAVEAGRLAKIPTMVDFAEFRKERPFQDLVLKHLRLGDIYTHTYLGAVPMIDPEGQVLPYLFEAKKRGVIFDVGHGGGSFQWRQAVPAVRQGFLPDSISTDLHVSSMNAGMKDMLNVMSKFLTLGLSLDDVILRSTWNPAREIHHEELGHLTVGAGADISVLRLVKGDFGFLDSSGRRMNGNQKLVAELTIHDGRVVWDLNGLAAADWQAAPAPRTKK